MVGGSIRGLFSWVALVGGLAGGAFGCNGETPDDPPPCWDMTDTTPAGSTEIGTGELEFEVLPESIEFIHGVQDGYLFPVRSRIRGLSPGNATDIHDPSNPKTYFSAVLFDGTVVKDECPLAVGYRPDEGDTFDLGRPFYIEFLPRSVAEKTFDRELTVVVEVIDNEGRYARAEGAVVGMPPTPADAGVAE